MEYRIEGMMPLTAEEQERVYEINSEIETARRIVEETRANLFLTGKAGTGKTTFLRNLVADTEKQIAVLAPTGVAAINARGVTINSFLQLPFSPFVPGTGFIGEPQKRFHRFAQSKLKLIKSLDLIVIDEVSMVRSDMMDAIDDILRRIRGNSEPFGGVQLLLIGDLRQLSPVVRGDEWEILKNYYPTPYFFDSLALKRSGFYALELTKIFRQSDEEFVALLNGVRNGSISDAGVAKINERHIRNFQPDDSEGYIRLCTHNWQADRINSVRMSQLPSEPYTYNAVVKGDFPTHSFPADGSLTLRKGAQVMFIRNDSGSERQFYNGMIGTVTDITDQKVWVLPVGGLKEIETEPLQWENIAYELDEESGEIKQKIKGTFMQMPLRPAWAITIHKSQGLTFDRAIIDVERSFAAGQTYVALSRCRSLEGMVLSNPLSKNAIITDAAVNNFEACCERLKPDMMTIDMMRADNYLHSLRDFFSYRAIVNAFDRFRRDVATYLEPVYPDLYRPYRDMEEALESRVLLVGNRFISLYASDITGGPSDEEREAKIRSGCHYFQKELQKLVDLLKETPIVLPNASYTKILRNAYNQLEELVYVKNYLLRKYVIDRFTPQSYIRNKAQAAREYENKKLSIMPTPEKKKRRVSAASVMAEVPEKMPTEKSLKNKEPKEKKEKRPKGYSAYETLGMFESGMTFEQIAEARGLKLSTILNHFGQLIEKERVTLEQVMDAAMLARLKQLAEESVKRHCSFGMLCLENGIDSNYASFVLNHLDEPLQTEIRKIYAELREARERRKAEAAAAEASEQ